MKGDRDSKYVYLSSVTQYMHGRIPVIAPPQEVTENVTNIFSLLKCGAVAP
jgi:hypothetical protein